MNKQIGLNVIFSSLLAFALMLFSSKIFAQDGAATLSGELKMWHKVTLTFDGPEVSEDDEDNPFLNYRLNVTFTHPASGKMYVIPGYFAADGNAGKTSATSGNKWRVHIAPDALGEWTYELDFQKAQFIAVSDSKLYGENAFWSGKPAYDDKLHGITGTFNITKSDKSGRDFRGKGRLDYVGERYLKFKGTGEYFLKSGVDAPENFLSYADFDGTFHNDGHKDNLVKTWEAHLPDWKEGDPTWKDGKGKAIIGALNYLSSKGLNSVSFLTNNIVGDDQNVFPYVDYDSYDRFDVSKLDQWEMVFTHAEKKGLFLHFKLFEAENQGLLDGGAVGAMHKLYFRELIARFGHHLALNWNMGEENGEWFTKLITPPQFTSERLAMAEYFSKNDPYHHHVVIHNGVWYDDIYGKESKYTGASLQTSHEDFRSVHSKVLQILKESKEAGKQWAVACDEPGDHRYSLVPDNIDSDKANARGNALWGTFMAGGWGTEWYFGYEHPHSDLSCQDYRSRDLFWDQCRIALNFFSDYKIPVAEMINRNDVIENPENTNDKYCLAKEGELYLVFLNEGTTSKLDLREAVGEFDVSWFNPLKGGVPQKGKVKKVKGGNWVELGAAPKKAKQDWLVLVRKK